MGSPRIPVLLALCLLAGLPGAARAAAHPTCRGAVVADGTAVRIDLRCAGGVRRLSGSVDAEVRAIRTARAGSRTLRCALVGTPPSRRFTCAGHRTATGRLRLRLVLAGPAPCTLHATLHTRGPARGALRETALAGRLRACRAPSSPGPVATPAPTPVPAPPPVPAPSPSPAPPAPIPTTPTTTPTTPAAPTAGPYLVTYAGSETYALHRRNTYPGSSFAFDEHQQLGWTTTFAPVALAPGATQDATSDGADVLTGTASNHQDDEAVDTTVRSCSSTGAPREDPNAERPPQLVAHPVDATHVHLDVEAVDVAEWPAACTDGEHPALFLFDQDPDLDSSVLEASVTTTYAALAAGTVTVPTAAPAADAGRDCRAPDLHLTECTGDLRATGTLRIAPLP